MIDMNAEGITLGADGIFITENRINIRAGGISMELEGVALGAEGISIT